MKNYRIVYSEQKKKYKIQYKILWWYEDLTREFYDTLEEVKKELEACYAYDWEEIE